MSFSKRFTNLTINWLILFAIFIISISCKKNESAPQGIHLSGKIAGASNDSLLLRNHDYQELLSINIDSSSRFDSDLNLENGFYYLSHGKTRLYIYLKNNADLYIEIDSINQFEFNGSLRKENEYLYEKSKQRSTLDNMRYSQYYFQLTEDIFLQKSDSLETQEIAYLNQFKNKLPSNFYTLEQRNIEFEKRSRLFDYKYRRKYNVPNTVGVSNSFPEAMEGVNFNNASLASSPEFINLIETWLSIPLWDNPTSEDFNLRYIKNLKSQIVNPKVRSALVAKRIGLPIVRTKALDSLYALMKPMVAGSIFEIKLDEQYSSLKKVERGKPAPDFSLPDLDGKMVNLEDFRGKYVYIDLWATWCGPCIQLFPAVKKLEEQFEGHNIAFVSICKESKEDLWREIIDKKQPGGVQLFAKDNSLEILNIPGSGLPAFVFIDPDGNFHDANADWPNSKKLKGQLEGLLTKYN